MMDSPIMTRWREAVMTDVALMRHCWSPTVGCSIAQRRVFWVGINFVPIKMWLFGSITKT